MGLGAVGRVEPHLVALPGAAGAQVQREAGGGRYRPAALAGRHAPELGGRAVRVGQDGGAARLGQQRAARGDPVEPRRRVALERERGRARGDAVLMFTKKWSD